MICPSSPRISPVSASLRKDKWNDIENERSETTTEMLTFHKRIIDRKSNEQSSNTTTCMDTDMTDNSHVHDDQDTNNNDPDIHVASALFVCVGIGYLFPFSALTQPVDYWNLLFPDFNIEFPLATTYMYTNLVMLGLLVFLGGGSEQHNNNLNSNDGLSSSPSSSPMSFTKRIVGGFIGQLLVLIFVPSCYFFIHDETYNTFAILASTSVAAIATAFLDSALISLSTQYPLRVQESFQLGVGISTLIGSIYRDMTKLAFPSDMIVGSSLLYFYCGALTIALCIGAYYQLIKLPLSEKLLAQAMYQQQQNYQAKRDEEQQQCEYSESSVLLPQKNKPSNSNDNNNNNNTSLSPTISNKWSVLRKIFFNEIMVCLLFTSTLALWPPLITEIKSFNNSVLQDSGWWSLILLTIFSVTDCIGRIMVRYRLCFDRNNIWVAVLGRFVILFPLIICSVKGYVFTNDIFSILFVSILGWTNGYIGTLSIILVNECVTTQDELKIAGMFTSFFLNTGLVIGATIGLFLEKLI